MKKATLLVTAIIVGICFSIAAAEDGVFLSVGSDRNISKIRELAYLPKSNHAITVSSDKCVRLWDVNGWKKIDEFRFLIGQGRVGEIKSLAVTKDETRFAIGQFGRPGLVNGDIIVVQMTPRKILQRLRRHEDSVTHLAFFDEDQKLLSVDESGLLVLWDLKRGKAIGNVSFKKANERISCLHVNDQGQVVLGTTGGNLHILSLSPLRLIQSKTNAHPKKIRAAVWTEDNRLFSLGDGGNLNLWRLEDDQLVRQNQKQLGDLNNLIALTTDRPRQEFYAFFGADENREEAGKTEISCRVFGFDLSDKRRLKQFDDPERLVRHAQLSSERNELIVGLVSSTIEVWDLTTNQRRDRFENEAKDLFRVKIDQFDEKSSDALQVLWREERQFKLDKSKVPLTHGFDLLKRQLFEPKGAGQMQTENYKVDSRMIGMSRTNRNQWAIINDRGQPNGSVFSIRDDRHGSLITEAALISADVALIGTDEGLFLFDTRNGAEIKPLDQQFGGIHSISFSRDRRFFLTYSVDDRSTAIWSVGDNPRDPQLMSRLMVVGEEWAMVAPNGYFDCTPAAEKFFGWHVNGSETEFATFHELDQFRDKFYKPSLFEILWDTADLKRSLKYLRIAENSGIRGSLGPRVSLFAPSESSLTQKSPDNIEIEVGFEPNGQEVPSAVALLINNRPHDRYYHEVEADETKHSFTVKLAHGKQEIAAKVFSQTRNSAVSDRRMEVDFRPYDSQQAAQGKLFFLGVGINGYTNYNDLDYCQSDVNDIGQVFATGSKDAFYEQPEIVATQVKSKQNFRSELTKLLQDANGENEFGQTDTLVVMWSGHGDVDNENNFYLVLPDCEQPTEINDDSLRKNGLSALEIARELRGLNGGHVILILDTCYSGKAVEQFRDSSGNLARRTNSDDFGIMVISAAGATETSKENSELGMSNFAFLLKTGLLGLSRYRVGEKKVTAQASPLVLLDGKNIVTTHSLVKFLRTEMPGISETQTISTNGFGGRIRFLANR